MRGALGATATYRYVESCLRSSRAPDESWTTRASAHSVGRRLQSRSTLRPNGMRRESRDCAESGDSADREALSASAAVKNNPTSQAAGDAWPTEAGGAVTAMVAKCAWRFNGRSL